MKFYTADRETGTFIEAFDSYHEAVDAIKRYEESDKEEGTYTEDFYEVEAENHCRVNDRTFRIREEFWPQWGEEIGVTIEPYVTIKEIIHLAKEWGTSVDALMEQVEW